VISIIFDRKWWSFYSIQFIGLTAGLLYYGVFSSIHVINLIKSFCVTIGAAWFLCFGIFIIRWKKTIWWALIPGGVFLGAFTAFHLHRIEYPDLVLFIGIGLGLSLLIWGIGAKFFGLLIAGSILLTSAPGISAQWGGKLHENTLAQTGTMLIWFGLGWIIIAISSRVIYDKFIWWPLIPGGVFEIVGIGLFLSGNQNFAGGVLSNSTLMNILLFGAYILFLRMNFKK